jgi:hypothetical protein
MACELGMNLRRHFEDNGGLTRLALGRAGFRHFVRIAGRHLSHTHPIEALFRGPLITDTAVFSSLWSYWSCALSHYLTSQNSL